VVVWPVEESGSGGDGRATTDLAGVGAWQGRGRTGGTQSGRAVLNLAGRRSIWSVETRRVVILAAVLGDGRCSKPTVEIGVPRVGCVEHTAAFVVPAVVNLGMEAPPQIPASIRFGDPPTRLCPAPTPATEVGRRCGGLRDGGASGGGKFLGHIFLSSQGPLCGKENKISGFFVK
jgi:hypothetical protein